MPRTLGLSPAPVRNHSARIHAKAQIGSRAAPPKALMTEATADRRLF